MDTVYEIHCQLRKTIADNFGKFHMESYRTLLNSLKPKLTTKELEGARDMYDILDSLQLNGTIAIGKYQYLIEKMSNFNEDVKRVIEKAQMDITKILSESQVTDKADNIRKYERTPEQTGFVLFYNLHQANSDNELTVDLEKFFKENLGFECCNISLENNQTDRKQAKKALDAADAFYCFVCFVIGCNEECQSKFTDIKEMTDGLTNKPKLFIFLSYNGTVSCPGSNHGQNDADILVVNASIDEASRMLDVFKENYNNKHFEEMLVGFRHGLVHSEQNHSTFPWSMSTLTKLFYLEAGKKFIA